MKLRVFILLSVLKVSNGSEECRTFDNSPGVCLMQENCLTVKRLNVDLQSKFLKEKCDFDGVGSGICCPIESDNKRISDSVIERKSIAACKSFGVRPHHTIVTRIVGGKPSDKHEFPQYAALGYRHRDEIEFRIGGTLISNKFILTVAHCCSESSPFMARLGKTVLIDDYEDFSKSDYNVKRVIIHPHYGLSLDNYNDIALVELSQHVVLSYEIWPACLFQQESAINQSLSIAGFGITQEIDRTLKSNKLMKAEVEEIPLSECRKNYIDLYHDEKNVPGLSEGINETLLCAKNRKVHADACEGDSGAGLFLLSDENYYVVGVTSFGVSCNTSLPSFYTRVFKYLDWIESYVWNE